MQITKYTFLVLIAIVFFGQSCTTTSSTSKTKGEISFTILQLNDVYEIAPLEGGKVGGMARVETFQKKLQAENPNTITVHAGDFLSPSLIGTIKDNGKRIKGAQMVDVMNAMGFDYVTYGNHEFDLKPADFQSRMNESNFGWTSCNTFRADTKEAFYREKDGKKEAVPEYAIHEVKNAAGDKMNIGIIGVTIPFNKAKYVHYEDVNESARKTYDKIKDQIDIAIAITHLDRYQDSLLAVAMPEFKLLIGGHDHNNMEFNVGKVKITKADANARTVYVHRFKYNTSSKKSSFTSELVKIDDKIEDDPEVKKVVDKWLNKVDEIMSSGGYDANEIICKTDKILDGLEIHIREFPTELGYVTSEAMWAQDKTADFAVINSGSVRVDDKLTGNITQYDILRTFPFGGGITLIELDGKNTKKLLEIGLVKNIGVGGFLQTTRNVTSKDGKHMIDGKAIDDAKTYKILLPDFVAQGKEQNLEFLGDNYTDVYLNSHKTFSTGVKNDIVDMVIAYLRTYK
ncbi:MAG: bifunctional metallophosphatase/5'-nucleotidase [Aureispira sp.]|nr:bifunctional metallophosphatase/5'-nucleotidase [Aureispira sp.]